MVLETAAELQRVCRELGIKLVATNDVHYVDNITFLEDWKIIFKTVITVLKRDGINSETSVTMEEFKGTEKEPVGHE